MKFKTEGKLADGYLNVDDRQGKIKKTIALRGCYSFYAAEFGLTALNQSDGALMHPNFMFTGKYVQGCYASNPTNLIFKQHCCPRKSAYHPKPRPYHPTPHQLPMRFKHDTDRHWRNTQ